MTGGSSNSPCGACKFLRRKCVKGCVFAPYFSHEQGSDHFAAIHKVFGASNASKLLAHLPVNDRSEAAVTIAYEAQARLQDPIYGCVSHIFSLQQQVVNLQAQLALLKEQATQCIINNSNSTTNPNHGRFFCENSSFTIDSQSWLQNQAKTAQFNENLENMIGKIPHYTAQNTYPKYENYDFPEENTSFCSMDSMLEMQLNEKCSFQDEADELRTAAFRYIQHS